MSKKINTQFLAPAQQFYQRHDSKIVLLVVILLAIYLLSVIAKLTWSLLPTPQAEQSAQQVSQQSSSNIGASQSKTKLNELLKLNLFGDAQKAPEPVVEEVTQAPETQLNLVLSGVVASTAEDGGAAVIAYRNTQATYGIGDKIEGTNVTLESIFSDRVIIKNRANRETLMLEGVDFDEANRRLEREKVREIDQFSQIDTESITDNDINDLRQQVLSSPQTFTEFINISPAMGEDGLSGFRVSPGSKAAFFNAVGLENGDIITNLNGLDLTDLRDAAEARVELREAEVLDLELIRNGQPISLSIEIPRE